MECKKCSATIVEGAMFCHICGARTDGNKICSKCEKLIPENSKFCAFCGTRQTEETVVVEVSKTESIEKQTEETVVVEVSKTESIEKQIEEVVEDLPKTESKETTSEETTIIPIELSVPNVTVPVMPTNVTDSEEYSVFTPKEDTSEDESEDADIITPLICTQCGSADIEFISEELGKCNNCGTQVVINKAKETNYVTNNVTINMDGNRDNSIGFFELPKEINEKTFYANALTQIAFDKYSPEDVFLVSKFEPVKTEYRQYVLARGTAEMTYSATVGYDREERYQVYNNNSKSYETKTKTVTDWKPFSGSYTGEYTESVNNDNNPDILDAKEYRKNCLDISKEYDASVSKSPCPLAPSSESINELKREIKARAKADCERKLPGDRKKDFSCNGYVSLSTVESHVAPQYILKYRYICTYEGAYKNYTLKAHACKKSLIRGDMPSAKKEIEMEIEHNKFVKAFNITTLCTLLFSILSAILFPIVLKIVFAVIGVISFTTYWIIRTNVSKGIYKQKFNKKRQTLISHLKSKGIGVPKTLLEGVQK